MAKTRLRLCAGGALCLTAWLALALLERSLPGYLLCMTLAWAGMWLIWQNEAATPTRWLWAGALLWRLIGLGAEPVFENDWARFLWDGWLGSQGHDPFLSVPMQYFGDASVPAALQAALDQMNHPDLRTVYGPVAQAAFALAAWLAAGSLLTLKLVLLLADVMLLGLLHRWYGARALWLYGWCPLVIQETAFSAHPDVLALLPLLIAWRWRSGMMMALAIAARPHALLLAPFILRDRRTATKAALTLAACYTPFFLSGHAAEWQTLSQMGGGWHFNDLLLSALVFWMAESLAKMLCAMVLLSAAVWMWWKKQPRMAALYALWWITSSVANAWYLQYAVLFLALGERSRLAWALILVSPLTYAHGLQVGDGLGPWDLAPWVMPLEWLAIAAAALCAWRDRRNALASQR